MSVNDNKPTYPGLPFSVSIDPEQVNLMVTQAILGSALGSTIKDAVNNVLQSMTTVNFYDSSKKSALVLTIEGEVLKIIRNILSSEPVASDLKNAVKALMTEDIMANIINASVTTLIEKLDSMDRSKY